MISAIKQEWRLFRDDPPGQRFENHSVRLHGRSRSLMVAQVGAGVVMFLAGVVMLFIPGPGIVAMVFGIGLISGVSRRMSAMLDRAEPPLRLRGAALQRRWHRLPLGAKVGLVAVVGALAAAAMYLGWRWMTG